MLIFGSKSSAKYASLPFLHTLCSPTDVPMVTVSAHFDGGYFDADGKVHYYVPDYQGNIVADVTADGEIVQTASYYPYGEPWLEPEGDNRRLYGGKERLNFGALRHSDYGPRLLDTRSGRWNSQDAYGEKYRHLSPYSLCGGDPINNIDPSGNVIQTMINGIAYQYINGSNGWGFYNNDEQYQSGDVFADALVEALATLQRGVVGSTLVESLVDSEKTVHIKEGKENCWIAEDMTIHFNPFKKTSSIVDFGDYYWPQEAEVYISLAHEMFHAESALAGYTYRIGGGYGNLTFSTDEWWAVAGENYIRGEHGIYYRVGYGITNGADKIYPYRCLKVMFPDSYFNNWLFNYKERIIKTLKFRQRYRK